MPTGPVWTGRGLRLPTPPTAEHAAELAQRAADAALNVSGIELDYTPGSLGHVDAILDSFREPGSDAVAETIFVFGCYIGEVLVRHAQHRLLLSAGRKPAAQGEPGWLIRLMAVAEGFEPPDGVSRLSLSS